MSQFARPSHLIAIVATMVATALLIPLARRWPGRWLLVARCVLGTFLIANEIGYEAVLAAQGRWNAGYSLPLYLCDFAAFCAGVALLWPNRKLVELTWFWALAGTLQGLLTPDQVLTFPSYDWFQFYGDHGGVVLAALLLVVGMRIHPQAGAVTRVFAATVVFTAVAAVADLISGGNYMYLRRVPSNGSLLSVLGPWPWYILSSAGLAVVLIVALDMPFWPERRRRRAGGAAGGTVRVGSAADPEDEPAASATARGGR